MFMQERWLSVGEIAAHLGVNPDTIYKWIDRKKMPAHKLGRLWKFLASEVDQWVKGGHAAEDAASTAPGAATKRKMPPR
jgi:excisionase family DNA binding protein